jgi:hypothetical protein
MAGASADGRWIEEPVLPLLPPPPADRILVRGTRLIRVAFIHRGQRRGFTEAAVLAWARTGDGGWGVLTAWQGAWQENGRTTGRARWGWCRLDVDLVEPRPVPRRIAEDDEWHGHHPMEEFTEAIRQAAASLPEHLRQAALAPAAPRAAGQRPA